MGGKALQRGNSKQENEAEKQFKEENVGHDASAVMRKERAHLPLAL